MMTDQSSVEESGRPVEAGGEILRTRYELGEGYVDVSSAEAADLVVTLEATASATIGPTASTARKRSPWRMAWWTTTSPDVADGRASAERRPDNGNR